MSRPLWNGTVVDDPASFMVPPRAAYTSQTPRLFSDTLRQNILLKPGDQVQITYKEATAIKVQPAER